MVTPPVIAIVGQTASGKSAVAVELAERLSGEIICADSRTVYRGMDIGTAKPSRQDRERVVHHGLDLISPDQTFSAYDFQKYAKQKIQDIHALGKLPIVVGGTGLYLDGLIYDYSFGPAPRQERRAELASKSLAELQELAESIGIESSDSSFQNPRHLSRKIERGNIVLQKKQLPTHVFLGAIRTTKEVLGRRVEQRFDDMVQRGLVDEVKLLVAEYGHHAPGLQAPIYKPMVEYLSGSMSWEEACAQAVKNDMQLAKRQLTWFRRNPDIVWVQSNEDLKKEITLFVTKI